MYRWPKDIAARIHTLYLPTSREASWSFDEFIGRRPVRYFGYGRWALFSALQVAGVVKNDKVLLPAFICRDLLSAINTIGAIPLYYNVNENMQLADDPDSLIPAKAILAVNYFGFPQVLAPFQDYCKKTGAVLVEDNAHGFLSRDQEGNVLGTRGELGIFSLRKTLMLPNGAALVVNANDKDYMLKPQIQPLQAAYSASFAVKGFLRKAPMPVDIRMIRSLASIIRTIRKIITGQRIAPSAPDAEFNLPGNAAPCIELRYSLDHLDADQEISRRRELYRLLDSVLKENGIVPLFASLPDQVVPYAYPYYVSGSMMNKVEQVLQKLNLECFPWPELPDIIAPSAPRRYKELRMIPFLW